MGTYTVHFGCTRRGTNNSAVTEPCPCLVQAWESHASHLQRTLQVQLFISDLHRVCPLRIRAFGLPLSYLHTVFTAFFGMP